jgi:hypothetical protein
MSDEKVMKVGKKSVVVGGWVGEGLAKYTKRTHCAHECVSVCVCVRARARARVCVGVWVRARERAQAEFSQAHQRPNGRCVHHQHKAIGQSARGMMRAPTPTFVQYPLRPPTICARPLSTLMLFHAPLRRVG